MINKDLLIVNTEEELQKAIDALLHDTGLRIRLEQSSRQYWENIANPKSVMQTIINKFS